MLFLTSSSAVAQDVRYNFANTRFEKYKTYKWIEIKDAQKVDEEKHKQIKDAFDVQLAKKHLSQTDADTADLYIGYQVGVDAEKQITFYNSDWGYGPGWSNEGFYGGTYGKSMIPTSTLHSGELVLDMYDPRQRCLVWRGVVSKTFDPTSPPNIQEKILHHSVDKLLRKYPPPPLDSLSY
jgi:hypothetical protein